MDPAQESFMAAYMRNPQRRGGLLFAVDEVLPPNEIVYEFASGTLKNDSFPILMITNQRVLYTARKLFRGWGITAELPAHQVAGVSYERRWITGRIPVHGRDGNRFTCKVRLDQQEVEWRPLYG